MTAQNPLKVALIGNGAIAKVVAQHCQASAGCFAVTGALGLPQDTDSVGVHPLVPDLKALLAASPDLVVECASQSAVEAFGPAILEAGVNLIVISVGALADETLSNALQSAANVGGAQVLIPSGALAGLDGVAAASQDALEAVSLTSTKPPLAWAGAPGVADLDLTKVSEPVTIFEGSAREAARLFPKNANVAAALAIAGVGMDATRVRLVADPNAIQNSHKVETRGAFGHLSATVMAEPSPKNPKTSYLAALSITRLLDRLRAQIAI